MSHGEGDRARRRTRRRALRRGRGDVTFGVRTGLVCRSGQGEERASHLNSFVSNFALIGAFLIVIAISW